MRKTETETEIETEEDPSVLSDPRLREFRSDVAAVLGVDPLLVKIAGRGKAPQVAARIVAEFARLGRERCKAVVLEALEKHRAEKGTGDDPRSLSFFPGWLEQAAAVEAPRPEREPDPGEPLVTKRVIGPGGGIIEYHA